MTTRRPQGSVPMVLVFEGTVAYGFASLEDAGGYFESLDLTAGSHTAFTTDGEVLMLRPTDGLWGRIDRARQMDVPGLHAAIAACTNCPEDLRNDPVALARFLGLQ